MSKLFAFLRRDALVAASYRMRMLFSFGGLITVLVPLYFVADALQPVVGEAIASEGGEYFGFVVAGLATTQFVMTAVGALPSALASGLRTGTFEALLTTPTRLQTLLSGMAIYPLAWSGVRAAVMIVLGQVLGAAYALDRMPLVLLIWTVISLAYLPFGILGGALLLLFRTTGPLPSVVLTASMLLGGVYYPTHVIPSWIESVSAVVPLTYGLRALRRVLAADLPLAQVGMDLGILAAFAATWLAISLTVFQVALARARQAGSLAQY